MWEQITLALLLTGSNGLLQSLFLLLAQIAGSIAASALALGLFQTVLPVRTTLTNGVSIPCGLLIEAILMTELTFVILMLANDKHRATFIAPLGIGFALFVGELVGVYWTGGSLNPTRSFGPNVVSWRWETTHWIYWVGPMIGSIIAAIIYKTLKRFEMNMSHPNQDVGDENAAHSPYEAVTGRQGELTAKVLRNLGIDTYDATYGPVGYPDGQSIGVITLWHKRPRSNTVGEDVPAVGPLGTPTRQSREVGHRKDISVEGM
jgi:aquaporin related protein